VDDELAERRGLLARAPHLLLEVHALLDVRLRDQAGGDEELADLDLGEAADAVGRADPGGEVAVEVLLGEEAAGDEDDAEGTGLAGLALLGELEEGLEQRLARDELLLEYRPPQVEIVFRPHDPPVATAVPPGRPDMVVFPPGNSMTD